MTTSTAPTASHTDATGAAGHGLGALRRRVPTVVLFASSSLSSWTVDYVLVLTPIVMARLVSSSLNSLVNRRLFGAGDQSLKGSAAGYVAAQSALLAVSYTLIATLR